MLFRSKVNFCYDAMYMVEFVMYNSNYYVMLQNLMVKVILDAFYYKCTVAQPYVIVKNGTLE